ncbi:MAG: hypothetical protein A2279_04655 [Stygiobacter sp. RIFOXYA12_FULL_38_9]|nr:MAG: hypothetical protein A2X62_02855 [Stygiobacter sp. GWC2_38_9]OGU82199.1 MAG: hypothetical protein A2279_04655 [Stygiobacter sp. RIFOXYA12_FULL_38_9]OGV06499.1 MAG: hypothetical protein A2299_02225 [Stygiobacter sp. RIFOXYB2_FULL_37_11]OGV10559.1 MAG: hypothetical protein A2237_18670 [Stygiobacter sp. RIFOXYA2_FULL_38_8]OGV13240.1 MAG: hypothetical protein A2440_12995 [Stygiobacter sp. RIFOXYC2_FULL_38_25]OGV83286.1 MAG: hypothetical protein A2X65_16550 [Stygiobacter sp. GWF2_38_21]
MAYLKDKLKSKKPAITISRVAVKEEKLVYIGCANNRIKYTYGRSKIAYIGTTKTGAGRIAASAAAKAKLLLNKHGINQLDFYVVVSGKRPNVITWRALESALLLTFRDIHGRVPEANKQGAKINRDKVKKLFKDTNLIKIIEELS